MTNDHQHCDRDPIECTYDALVGEYREAVAERDRLRAVVDAAQDLMLVIDSKPVEQWDDGVDGHDEIAVLRRALRQLDGTGVTGRDEGGPDGRT